MPEEIVAITIIGIISGTVLTIAIARMFFSYLRARAGTKSSDAGSSLTTSELESMLKRVVQDANEPLLERIETVEQAVIGNLKSLPAHEKDPVLDELRDGPNDLAAISKRQRGVSKA